MTRLDRDRLTRLTYAQLGVFGFFLYGFGASVSLLRDERGYSRALAGLHGTALAAGAMASALVVAALVRRYGRGPVIWGGLALLGAGVVVYVAGTVLPLTLAGAFLGSFGGSFVVTSSAAVLTDRHGPGGASAVTEANAAAAGIGLVAPLVLGAAVALGLGWRSGLSLLLPALLLLAAVGRGVPVPAPPPGPEPVAAGRPGRLPARFWVSWLVLTAGIGVEFCMVLWTADSLRERVGVSPGAAAAGVTAVVAGMAVGRLAGGRLALRRSPDRLLLGAIATAGAGFALFWVTEHLLVALTGLTVCGLGVALFYPLGVVRAIAASDGRPDLASARGGLGAALASGAGPFVLGALADQVGLHLAFLVVPGLLLVAAVGVRSGRVGQAAVPVGTRD
jgi:predicted MFS family arabinose efflux permease